MTSRRISLVAQTTEHLRRLIRDEFAKAERLPPEGALAARLGISRPTLREAIGVLWHEGLLQKKWGVGTVIVHRGANRTVDDHLSLPLLQIESTTQKIRNSGAQPGVKSLSVTTVLADQRIASLLDLDIGTPVWMIDRVHTADGEPFLRAVDLVPHEIDGRAVDVSQFDALQAPLFDILRLSGCPVERVEGALSAVVADKGLSKSLSVSLGAPLLRAEQSSHQSNGTIVMFGSVWHRADKTDLRYTRSLKPEKKERA